MAKQHQQREISEEPDILVVTEMTERVLSSPNIEQISQQSIS